MKTQLFIYVTLCHLEDGCVVIKAVLKTVYCNKNRAIRKTKQTRQSTLVKHLKLQHKMSVKIIAQNNGYEEAIEIIRSRSTITPYKKCLVVYFIKRVHKRCYYEMIQTLKVWKKGLEMCYNVKTPAKRMCFFAWN